MKLVGKNSNIVCCTFNVLNCTENLKTRQVKVSKTIPKGLWHYFKLANFLNPSNKFRKKFIELHRGIVSVQFIPAPVHCGVTQDHFYSINALLEISY